MSRVAFDPNDSEGRRLLESPYYMMGFADASVDGHKAPDRDAGRLLYYCDPSGPAPQLVIQAPVVPLFDHIRQSAMIFTATEEITEWIDALADGDLYRFDLAAAPRTRDAQTRLAYPKAAEERLPWLHQQLDASARLITATVDSVLEFTIDRSTHTQVRFSGLLEVTDSDALVDLLLDGMGPSKAHGNGLLRLTREPATDAGDQAHHDGSATPDSRELSHA
jgi:CRISPR associated protein